MPSALESCLHRQMLKLLAVVTDLDLLWSWFFKGLPTQYLHFVADEYFHNVTSETEIRNRFLDLLGDALFVAPGVVTARYQRGESLSIPTCSLQGHSTARLVAAGILVACWLATSSALPCPHREGLCPRVSGMWLAHLPLQFPCLSELRNADQFLLFLFLLLLQDHVENSYLPIIFCGQPPRLLFGSVFPNTLTMRRGGAFRERRLLVGTQAHPPFFLCHSLPFSFSSTTMKWN